MQNVSILHNYIYPKYTDFIKIGTDIGKDRSRSENITTGTNNASNLRKQYTKMLERGFRYF